MNKYADLAAILFKAGAGEGSHGGRVVGHTKSGKPIYASSSHPEHASFTPQEHTDAMNAHHEIWSKTQDRIHQIKQKRPHWHPPKQISQFLQHHHDQMRMHQNRASRGAARAEAPKKFGVKEGVGTAAHPFHTPQNIHKGLNDIEVPFMAAVVVISPDRKKVLLGKRDKDNKGWESPAGHADIGERPEDVVIRECFEEFNIPLKEEQLEHLPIMYKKDMTPIHCFMAVTTEDQIKDISVEDDPSQEHTRWKWFALSGELPDAMEDMRFNIVVHAKMKLAGLGEMSKSFIMLDETEGMSQMHTTEFAEESEHGAKFQALAERIMRDYSPGDAPRAIPLQNADLYLVRVDDGIYSGFVKKIDPNGLEETVANIDKMTIPAMTQFLRAKQLIQAEEPHSDKEQHLKIILESLLKPKLPETLIYVSMDGDGIGNRVAQAEAENDEQKLMEMSHKINAGQSVFSTWVQSVGGSIIESGGDEGLAKVPASALEKVENFRAQYLSVSGATVTVGIGATISESTRARELGKLKGKNHTEIFGANTDAELKIRLVPQTEAQKILDSNVLKLMKAVEAADVEKVMPKTKKEVKTKTEKEVERETCITWAARAISAWQAGHKARAMHYADEALEHASQVKDEGKTVGDIQRILKQKGVPFDDDVEKALPVEPPGYGAPIAGVGATPDATAAPSDFQPPEEPKKFPIELKVPKKAEKP